MEIFFIALILLAQGWFFYQTLRKINLLKGVFSEVAGYNVLRLSLLQADLQAIAPAQLLEQLAVYHKRASDHPNEAIVTVGLLKAYEGNAVGADIVRAINVYLLSNSGVAPEFNLVKDVAERSSDAVETEIGATIFLPLYLGLLGTLLGIVFGLSHISGFSLGTTSGSATTMLDQAIPLLLGGVKVAMIASFTGLLLTVVHSGFFYRIARATNDRRKNEFFTFIQVELLPLLSGNQHMSMQSMQLGLLQFNRDFSQNIRQLDGLMNRQYQAMQAQEQFMETLSKIDIMEFAAANVKVLSGLKSAVRSFGDFNEYVGGVNTALQKADDVIARLDQLLSRTDNLDRVTADLLTTFREHKELMDFIKSHFAALDSSKQLIGTAVINTGEYLAKVIDELKYFTEEKVAAVRTIEINEAALMQDAYPERWRNLDELKKMNQVITALSDLNNNHVQEMVLVNRSLKEVKETVAGLKEGIPLRFRMPAFRKTINKWLR